MNPNIILARQKAFFPHIDDARFSLYDFTAPSPSEDFPLYGDGILDTLNLVLDGTEQNLVSYIMKHGSEASTEQVLNLISKKVSERSPQMSDEDMLALLIPKNMQTAGELAYYQQTIETELRNIIAKEDAAKASSDSSADFSADSSSVSE